VLLGAMLVPVLGAGALVATMVGGRWQDRNATTRLATAADDLGVLIDAVAAITDEQAHTTVLVLGAAFDVDVPDGSRAALATARAEVDRMATVPAARAAEPALGQLGRMRDSFDAGELDFLELSQSFVDVQERLALAWSEGLEDVGDVADEGDQPAWLRARLRTLRESVAAVVPSMQRVRSSLHVDLGDRDPTVVAELLRSNATFGEAVARTDPEPGSAAEAAWQAFRADPAARRLEAHLAYSEEVAFGTVASPFAADIAGLSDVLDDGVRWSALIADTARAAAADLQEAAHDQARSDERSVALWIAAALLVAVASVLAAIVIARRLVAPVDGLAAASRRIAAGDLAVALVSPGGTQELVETVHAFNDMAGTLAAVEANAIALAGHSGAERPAPLPGRTGQALQDALDLLQSAMQEVEERRAELAVLASHDELTGLLNRRAALDGIERDLARVRRSGDRLALLYVDLDGLKALNDRSGHAVGDAAIRATAQAVASCVREGDLVARLGGDEFVVATVVAADETGAESALAGRIRDAVHTSEIETRDGPTRLSCSIGVALTDGASSGERLIARADQALYAAKAAGRDRVAWAS
jgi:diguanylate cyclase (GGDEF)-like protein